MISLAIAPEDGQTERYGRAVNKLQRNVSMGSDYVAGELLYNEKFTEFNPSDPNEQKGWYVALTVKKKDDGEDKYDMYLEMVNGDHEDPVLCNDGFAVIKVRDPATQGVTFFAVEKDGDPLKDERFDEKTYNFRMLELVPQEPAMG